MDVFKRSQPRASMARPEPAPRRITTPAGERLSVILENGDFASRAGGTKASRPFGRSAPSGFETVSEGEDSLEGEKRNQLNALRENPQIARRGGWKRLALVALLFLCVVIAVVLGIVFGLRTRNTGSDNNKDNQTNDDGTPQNQTPTNPALPPAPTTTDVTGRPEGFPVGSYSMATFLDTVQANCTENPATWSCYPLTTYNDNKQQSLAIFNWAIIQDGDSYKISSTNNPFSIMFENEPLTLESEGQDSERYTFRITQDKSVSPTEDITGNNIATTCDFDRTNFVASLYTRRSKDYPENNSTPAEASFPLWPYRVKIEQTIAGGENVPTCYETPNGQQGARITEGLAAQDAGTLCSCFYRNWLTPN